MMFDMLIKGGQVVDPGGGYSGQLDVAITRDRIAAVAPDLPAAGAARVVDAMGLLVTPGLVDLHTHVYPGVTYWGIDAQPVAARSGVTTWIDAGSAGAFNVIGFRSYVAQRSDVRIYGLLNISAIGLTAATGEHLNLDHCDVDLCCRLIDLHRDLLLGVKVRIDRFTTGDHGLEPLRRARQAAERCDLPLMVHIGIAPPAVDDVLELLRPGDILTHCCTGNTMRVTDDAGELRAAAQRARERGVVFDIGHGAGSFAFETAEALARMGHWPDVISSDAHQISVHGPMFDLPTCLSKFLALGMPLPDVIRAATSRPAEVIGLSDAVGTLRPGAYADVALFRLHRGRFPLYDVQMQRREARELLRCTQTIVGGRTLAERPDEPPAPWIELTDAQRALIQRGHTPPHMARRAEHGEETAPGARPDDALDDEPAR